MVTGHERCHITAQISITAWPPDTRRPSGVTAQTRSSHCSRLTWNLVIPDVLWQGTTVSRSSWSRESSRSTVNVHMPQ